MLCSVTWEVSAGASRLDLGGTFAYSRAVIVTRLRRAISRSSVLDPGLAPGGDRDGAERQAADGDVAQAALGHRVR